MTILLGAIGDDVTGSTDLALMLAKHGMSTIQYLGVPGKEVKASECQAAVVALKSRTAPLNEAVEQSISACDWLLELGPEIDPGVPWTVSVSDKPICLALKSGNFGSEDFFSKALNLLP